MYKLNSRHQINCCSKNPVILSALIALIFSLSIFFTACGKPEAESTVQQAYDLRLQGKADDAVQMLEKIIASDSRNASAYNELARAKFHIALGKGQAIVNSITEIQALNDTAISLDPENIAYLFLQGEITFFQAYMAMQGGQANMKDAVTSVCEIYERILELKPDYKEAMLYLVEFYGAIPEEMGGDKAKAEEFVIKLEELDRVYGMKARLFILPDETDRIEYWQSKLENHPDNPEIMEELGKDYLFAGNIEKGIDLLEQALDLAPEKPTLLLDMARYYLMTMMRGQEPDEKTSAKIKELFNRYLETDPISPLKAYTLELMAKFYFGLNDNNEADRLRNEAIAVDPYYSKAFGLPPAILFTPPGEISYIHRYHFRPF